MSSEHYFSFKNHFIEKLDTDLFLQASFWLVYVNVSVAFTVTALPIVAMLNPSYSKQRHFAGCQLALSIIIRVKSLGSSPCC